MELQIMTSMEPGILPEIQWNNEELKAEIAAKAKEYTSIAYTDGQETEMRKDRATLNKLVTAFENQRKEVKAFYQAPYQKFETQVKEVLGPVRDAIRVIDDGLTEIERQYRVDKTNKMREIYEANVGDLRAILPFEKTIEENWYKKAIKDKNLEQGYIDLFKRTRGDMDALDALPDRFRDKAVMKYMENYSLSEALTEGKRLEMLEAALEERRKKAEEAKAAQIKQQEEVPVPTVEKTAKVAVSAQGIAPVQKEAAPVVSLDFRVYGTKEQLMKLRQYMIDNQIKFGKVE